MWTNDDEVGLSLNAGPILAISPQQALFAGKQLIEAARQYLARDVFEVAGRRVESFSEACARATSRSLNSGKTVCVIRRDGCIFSTPHPGGTSNEKSVKTPPKAKSQPQVNR